MKKVLLASTALVAFAGAAAAEITITGSAEMGIVGGGTAATNGSLGETQFFNDINATFTMTGESDSGLSFGAKIDLDDAGSLGNEFSNEGDLSVFISGAFGTLTMGNTDGAIDWAITDAGNIGNPGSIDDAETSHLGYNGSFGDGRFDNQVLRYDYSFGDIGVAISYEQGVDNALGLTDGTLEPGDGNGTLALGVTYGLDLGGTTVNLGAGFSTSEGATAGLGDPSLEGDRDIWALGASAELAAGFSAGVTYQDWDYDAVAEAAGNLDVTHTAIGLGYETGPISVHANYGIFDFADGTEVDGFGIAAAYDLGGGLSAHVGFGDSDDGTAADYQTWSLGMAMSF